MGLDSYRRKIDRLKAERDAAVDRLRGCRERLGESESGVKAAEEARSAVQAVAQALQNEAHGQVASVVSRCLSAVFDDPYEFRIVFDRKRGKTEARAVFSRDGKEFDDPLNEIGGGVADVAAFALRLARVLLARPRRRKFLCLDEPWRNIRGRANRARVRAMLVGLSEELGVQFLLNVDRDAYPEFALGKIIELG